MLTVLAIDPGMKSTGWAFGAPGDVPRTGTEPLGKSGIREVRVWRNGMVWLFRLMDELRPSVVAIESPRYSSGHAHHTDVVLEGLSTIFRTVAAMKTGAEPIMVARNSAMKALTGKGRFDEGQAKPTVKAACVALGWASEDDPHDATDACAVWTAACLQLDPVFAANFTPLGRGHA